MTDGRTDIWTWNCRGAYRSRHDITQLHPGSDHMNITQDRIHQSIHPHRTGPFIQFGHSH